MADAREQRLPFPWRLGLLFVALAAGFVAFGAAGVIERRGTVLRQTGDELQSIADLKESQIERWRAERLDDGAAIQLSPTAILDVSRLLAHPADAAVRERVLQWLLSIRAAYRDYDAVFLLDARGGVLAADLQRELAPCPEIVRQAGEAARGGRVVLTDLHEDDAGEAHLGVLVPVGAASGTPAPAVVFAWINPKVYLFPLLTRWPVPSETGETLLVRREGEEVLFLNETRHRQGSALSLRLPLAADDLPASMAARGETGVVRGKDYRGVPVLAAVLPVPETGWFLVAKEDEAEVLAPFWRRSLLIVGMTIALILAAALGILLFWRQRETAFFRERYDEERRRVEAEERYQQLFERTSNAVVIYRAVEGGADFVIEAFNAAAERIEKVKREEVIGRRVTEVFPGVREFGLFEILQTVWKDGQPRHHPVSRYKDGRIEGWRENFVFRLPTGEVVALYEDATERKRDEESLRLSEAQYRGIFDEARDAILIFDEKGVLQEVNPAACRMYGYGHDEFVGLTGREFVHPDYQHLFREFFEMTSGGGTFAGESVDIRKDGALFPIEVRGSSFVFRGRPHLLAMVRDITDRKQAERRVAELRRQIDLVLSSTKTNIDIIDRDFNLRYVDDYWTKVYGPFEGRKCHEYFMGQKAMCEGCRIPEVLATKRLMVSEHTLPREGNRVIQVTTLPFQDDTGEWLVAEVNFDITERKRAEEKLKEYSENLERLVDERTKELDRVRADLFATAKLTAMGRMGAGLAHQLNSPLGGATLLVDGLIDGCGKGTEHEAPLQKIRAALDNMHNIVECMLTLSMMPRRGRAQRTPVDLSTAIGSILDLAMLDCSGKGIQQERSLSTGLPTIVARPGELDQIFLNLVNNAIDAMPEGGTLTVETRSSGGAVEARITDTGEGIPPEHLEKIFEPFFTTRRKRRGVGLGLSVVHEIVERYGGTIRVESEVGRGTTFVVRIPSDVLPDEETSSGDER